MSLFKKLFAGGDAAQAGEEIVNSLGRLARTIQEAAQPSPVAVKPAAKQLLDILRRRGDQGLFGYQEYPVIIDALVGDREPAQVVAELLTGMPTFPPAQFGVHASQARLYQTMVSHTHNRVRDGDPDWRLSEESYADVLKVIRKIAPSMRIDLFGCVGFLTQVIRRSIATGDEELRELVRDVIQAVVSSEHNRFHTMLKQAAEWREIAGFDRADIPFLRKVDEDVVAVEAQRQALFSAAGSPLGEVLRQYLDGSIKPYDKLKGQSEALDALLDGNREERGAALAFLLERIVTAKGYDGHAHLARVGGFWAAEYNSDQRPIPALDKLAFELAKRAHEPADADVTHARLVELLLAGESYRRETHRSILKGLLQTVARHPSGATVAQLRKLSKERAFQGWQADIRNAINDAAGSRATGNGETRLPPIPLPKFHLDKYDDLRAFEEHFSNLFEPRLYTEPHDSLIRTMAAIAARNDQAFRDGISAGRITRETATDLERARLPISVPSWLKITGHGTCSEMFLWAARDLHEKRETLRQFLATQPDVLHDLASLSDQIARKAAPSAKWVKLASQVRKNVPDQLWIEYLRAITQADAPGFSRYGINGEQHLRTFIYIASFLPADEVGPMLTQYALKKCYVTQPGIGIRCEKLGNACVWALANMPDGAGVPYLARILARTKYPKIRKKIDAQLNAAAEKAGIDRADLDEATVPTHDLDADGKRVVSFENGTATLVAEGSNAHIEWANADGKPVKAATAAMKEEKDLLKEVRADLKELQADLSIQPRRLQKLYLQDRSWPVADWRERYLDHPLMRGFTRKLVWLVEREGEDTVAALPDEAGVALHTITGEPVELDGATLRLWHPMDSSVEQIEAWRDRLEELRVTQPFAQVWREVYALTDAERATETYTNRWAAHILKQHQAMTLARINGWNVTARMWVDAPNDAPWHLHLPAHGLVAEYWVEGAGGDDPEVTDSGAYSFVNTDRVTFFRAQQGLADSAYGTGVGDPLRLEDIPPVVFSEVMRSCDLFTAVASIAADPAWLDRGQDAAHPSQWGHDARRYWETTNTGALAESGKRRRAMLERIIPRLAIADKLTLTDKALEVQGMHHTYSIHLGSGACSRSGRHICIVPKSTPKEAGKVWLPFEGDRTLSIIISKAVLLAADDKITDPVILAQI